MNNELDTRSTIGAINTDGMNVHHLTPQEIREALRICEEMAKEIDRIRLIINSGKEANENQS